MPLFMQPHGLTLVAHFQVSDTRTWGTTRDADFKESLRTASGIAQNTALAYQWFAFAIRVYVGSSLTKEARHKPDVENFPKLIVDAFTGLLYPDDNLDYVRGVQVEGQYVDDADLGTEIWILGFP